MRWSELNEKAKELIAPPAGFGEKLWFHGSTKAFKTFRGGSEKGINELGKGIYFTGKWNYANTWAREGGYVYECYIRDGWIYNYDKPMTPEIKKRLHVGHSDHMREIYGEGGVYDFDYFCKTFLSKERNDMLSVELGSKFLPMAGYVGAIKPDSQIPDQIVVWHPGDIVIARRGPGGEWRD